MSNKIYVALDLGSESMAAYYADAFGNGDMIKLQSKAPKLLGIGEEQADDPINGVLFLFEEMGGNNKPIRSPRMWNRVSFRDGAQSQTLTDDHAKLIFNSKMEYEKSLF